MEVIWDLLQARNRVHLQLSKIQDSTNGEDNSWDDDEQVTINLTLPTKGLFDPTDSQDNSWVCFYQIQCLGPHNREKLPKNPFNFWSVSPKGERFWHQGEQPKGELCS